MKPQVLAVRGGKATFPGGNPFPGWPVYDDLEEKAILEVLHSSRWGSTDGDVVATFEQEFADYQQADYATCLTNATVGLAVALRAVGVTIGDEVIVPPYTFIATASSAIFIGAVPVFADVDPITHLIDPSTVERSITQRTKAIVAVHLAGRPADLAALTEISRRHGLAIVEDAAQAHGASYRGRRVGAVGDVGAFSFQSSKNMTSGEGGVLVTNDAELASALYSSVNVGRVKGGGWYDHRSIGYNLRLTEFQAALLHAQLTRHPAQQQLRERNALLLSEALADLVDADELIIAPPSPDVTEHGRHLFIFRVPRLGACGLRDEAVEAMRAEGLPAVSTGYLPLQHNAALLKEAAVICDRLGRTYQPNECPNADLVAEDTIWLPHNYLLGTEEQTHDLADAIRKVVTAADLLAHRA